MSKIDCLNCKYYDFNACDGVDWCKLNHEETGVCGYCDREFEDLEEATTHYDALVEENNTFLMENSKMAGEIKDLQSQLAITEKALELAYEFNATTTCSGHCLDCCHKKICDSIDDLNKKQSNYIYYFKNKAKEMFENE